MIRFGVLGKGRITDDAIRAPGLRTGLAEIVVHSESGRGWQPSSRASRHPYSVVVHSKRVDAVYVATHSAGHALWATEALAAGKHVLVEKPLATTFEGLAALEDVHARFDGLLMEATHAQGEQWYVALPRIAEHHHLGALLCITATLAFSPPASSFRFNSELGGGVWLDCAPYWLRTLQALDSLRGYAVIDARSSTRDGCPIEAEVAIRLRSGITANIRCKFGSAHVADYVFEYEYGSVKRRSCFRNSTVSLQLNLHVSGPLGPAVVALRPNPAFDDQLRMFYAAVQQGGRDPAPDAFERTRLLLELQDAISRASSKESRA